MDRFSKICLLICVVLLAVIAFRPIVTPLPTHANSQPKYKYLVVLSGFDGEMQKGIDRQANDGWEFVSSIVNANTNQPVLVFRTER